MSHTASTQELDGIEALLAAAEKMADGGSFYTGNSDRVSLHNSDFHELPCFYHMTDEEIDNIVDYTRLEQFTESEQPHIMAHLIRYAAMYVIFDDYWADEAVEAYQLTVREARRAVEINNSKGQAA